MKVKRQNSFLSLVAFIELIFIACGGFFVAEIRNERPSFGWSTASLLIGLGSLGTVIYMYFKALKK